MYQAQIAYIDPNYVIRGGSADTMAQNESKPVDCYAIIDMALDVMENLEGSHREAVAGKPLHVRECSYVPNVGYPLEIRVEGQYIPQIRVAFRTKEEAQKMAAELREHLPGERLKKKIPPRTLERIKSLDELCLEHHDHAQEARQILARFHELFDVQKEAEKEGDDVFGNIKTAKAAVDSYRDEFITRSKNPIIIELINQ